MNIEPLTPGFGAEISGVDASALSDADFEALVNAFTDYGVVFMRDQPALDGDSHSALARRFGEIHVHPAARGRAAEHPGFIDMLVKEDTRVAAGNRWHSDVSCDEYPPQASILQLHKIPPVGGDTLFADLRAAYDALSPGMKVYLDGLTALHSGEASFRHLFKFNDTSNRWPEHDHPIVRKHLESGRPVLFVDREFTAHINELPAEEGRAVMAFLFHHTERVDFQCRFRWSENAIAIWDNRMVLHHAIWDYWPAQRHGHRVSVVGEKPVAWRLGEDEAAEVSLRRLTL